MFLEQLKERKKKSGVFEVIVKDKEGKLWKERTDENGIVTKELLDKEKPKVTVRVKIIPQNYLELPNEKLDVFDFTVNAECQIKDIKEQIKQKRGYEFNQITIHQDDKTYFAENQKIKLQMFGVLFAKISTLSVDYTDIRLYDSITLNPYSFKEKWEKIEEIKEKTEETNCLKIVNIKKYSNKKIRKKKKKLRSLSTYGSIIILTKKECHYWEKNC